MTIIRKLLATTVATLSLVAAGSAVAAKHDSGPRFDNHAYAIQVDHRHHGGRHYRHPKPGYNHKHGWHKKPHYYSQHRRYDRHHRWDRHPPKHRHYRSYRSSHVW